MQLFIEILISKVLYLTYLEMSPNFLFVGPKPAECDFSATVFSSTFVKLHALASAWYSPRVVVWLSSELSQHGTIVMPASKNARAGWSEMDEMLPVCTLLQGHISIAIFFADSVLCNEPDARAATPCPILVAWSRSTAVTMFFSACSDFPSPA